MLLADASTSSNNGLTLYTFPNHEQKQFRMENVRVIGNSRNGEFFVFEMHDDALGDTYSLFSIEQEREIFQFPYKPSITGGGWWDSNFLFVEMNGSYYICVTQDAQCSIVAKKSDFQDKRVADIAPLQQQALIYSSLVESDEGLTTQIWKYSVIQKTHEFLTEGNNFIISSDGNYLVFSKKDGSLWQYNLLSKERSLITPRFEGIPSFTKDNMLYYFDAQEGKKIVRIPIHK